MSDSFNGVSKVDLCVRDDFTVVSIETSNVFQNLTKDISRTMPNHTLVSNSRKNQVVITEVDIILVCCSFIYTYTFKTNDELPSTLRDIYMADIY